MNCRTIGIVGRGAFGTFLRERIEQYRVRVVAWDKNKESDNDPLETVLQCDVVIFAVPPKEYVPALEEFVPRTRMDAIIVDVCTVKMVTVAALERVASTRKYVATHPMFGPQSFIDRGSSLEGLQLVICESNLEKAALESLVSFLSSKVGLDVVTMTANEHDEVQAREQLLTQHIGCVMGLTGFALNERNIHTVSAKHFYRAMQIVGNDRELFKQAAALNPFWPRVLAQFEVGQAQHKLEMLSGT